MNRRHLIQNALSLTGLALVPALFEGCLKQASLAGDLNNGTRAKSVLPTNSLLAEEPMSTLVRGLEPGEPSEYNRAPKTDIALGRSFDPVDLSAIKRPGIQFEEVNIDHGSVGASFEFLYVADFESFAQVLKLDRNVSAHYLKDTLTSALNQTYDGSFSTNSINVVVRVWADHGRWSLNPGAKLTPDADALLKSDPKEFAMIYGTRYVATESRMNAIFAVLTIESASSIVKETMESTLSGGLGIGKLTANAKEILTKTITTTSESDRLSINAYTLGGKGAEGFKDMIAASIKKEADPLKSIATSISSVVGSMTASNAVPYSFLVGDMRNFGLQFRPEVVWSEQRSKALKTLSALNASATSKVANLRTIAAGKHPLNRMVPIDVKAVQEEVKQYDAYIDDLVIRHSECRQVASPSYLVPRAPWQRVVDAYLELLRPPTVQFLGMHLDAGQSQSQEVALDVLSKILDAPPSNRSAVIKSFFPRSTGVGVTIAPQGFGLSTFQLFDSLHGSTRRHSQSWDTVAIEYSGAANSGFILWSDVSPYTSLENQIFAEMRSKARHPLVYTGDTIDYTYRLNARITDKASRQFTFLLMECSAHVEVTDAGLSEPVVSEITYYPMGRY